MKMLASLVLIGAVLTSTPAPEVRVFAAASLSRIFTSAQSILGDSTRLTFNYAGSQQLALQLTQGASADVFAPADQRWMDEVEKAGLVAGPRRVFARNRLVVVTPAANPGNLQALADLAKPKLKVVLAADPVPAGRYSREVLRNLGDKGGLGADYRDRVLVNVVSEEENVEAVLSKIELGEADAGIVYLSDISPKLRSKVRTIEIPDDVNVVARYAIAVLKNATNPEGAHLFVDWIMSEAGQKLLTDNGFEAGE